MPQPISQNTLFYGDNLDILREYVPDESVDLIYLVPSFNSPGAGIRQRGVGWIRCWSRSASGA